MVIDKIEAYLKENGWASDSKTTYSISFSERGRGNGTDCRVDSAVLSQAKKLCREIRTFWPEAKVVLDICDEWVIIDVSLPRVAKV